MSCNTNCPTGLAVMGYFGAVVLQGVGSAFSTLGGNIPLRVTNFGVNASQKIDKPKLVDGRFDYTVFQVGALQVGGAVAFPLIYGNVNGKSADAFIKAIWQLAISRNSLTGRMSNEFNATAKYTNNTAFTYTGCQVDSLDISIKQGSMVDVSLNVIGRDRQAAPVIPTFNYDTRNSRAVTWNNVSAKLFGYNGLQVTGSECSIRTMDIKVANGVQRFYSLNGCLSPVDVTATKRDLSGSLTLIGRNNVLGNFAYAGANVGPDLIQNSTACNIDGAVELIIDPCASSQGQTTEAVDILIPGVVFEIEQMSLTTELFETSINWMAVPGEKFTGSVSNFSVTPDFFRS